MNSNVDVKLVEAMAEHALIGLVIFNPETGPQSTYRYLHSELCTLYHAHFSFDKLCEQNFGLIKIK